MDNFSKYCALRERCRETKINWKKSTHPSRIVAAVEGRAVMVGLKRGRYCLIVPKDTKWAEVLEWIDDTKGMKR